MNRFILFELEAMLFFYRLRYKLTSKKYRLFEKYFLGVFR